MSTKGNIDLPISSEGEDLFDLQKYYRGLANFIDGCETPLTIALQGDWGSGKTSMMNNIAARLASHSIIKFNTWQYAQLSGEKELPIALLGAITKEVTALENSTSATLKKKFAQIKKKFHVNLSLGIPNLVSFGYSDNADEEDENYYDSIKTFHEEFGTAIEYLNEKKKNENAKVVIFIDDLDRLHPSTAVELLEIIKIFLDVPGCVFVLSIDYEVVRLGVETKYGGQLMYQKGKSFFDKMIQLPFQVPVNFYKMDKLINNTLNRMGIAIKENLQFVELIEKCIGSNPRTVKRLLNSFELLVDILEINKSSNQEETYLYLLFILILQLFNEPLYRYCIRNNNLDLIIKEGQDNYSIEDLQTKLLGDFDDPNMFSVKKTVLFIESLKALLGNDENTKSDNIGLFKSLLQQSMITSSESAESLATKVIELTKETELSNLVIQGLIIDGNKEIVVNTFSDVFIRVLETTINSNDFQSFVSTRVKTKKASLPDRIFNELDASLSSGDAKYPMSSVKTIHGSQLVLHYGRTDLNRHLFKFLDAFGVHTKIFLRVIDSE